ncbi:MULTISPECIES: glycosyltransferase family 2 protein [unclassified Enterococcus]|uniref:glycosyltransferase n=1 Tax=unclassified Enterococcus TaxID=2608891 RepID=UPI0015543DAD|nr:MULTISPECIES: glycosyltransferase family 2 protein [unclassified Enterococcus]MBS7577966.1 glycosyltransferase [Enterococcus sp. MMGLQ5-2]MBS7585173.1 glycosyltransferase [Enterococcus sp. MMGLQ5-1]NPD13030.1 glycosyltransferase [Enterococcus sp. MMGLQ5-1]NPD37796.1 glycosyltransferase [Enterococcus sp. MMGLQ5-2]
MSECLLSSMEQEYSNFETIILDDSSDKFFLDKIDEFSLKYDTRVVRRKNRIGFKAGNINNYLKGKDDYEYFIILDSDEIIPPNFIIDSLKVFEAYQDVGIVQARHTGTRNENYFMQIFARSIKANWPTYLQTKQYYGFQFFFGHGALISKNCYQASGGFPHLVAEDLCFSLKARLKGYYTIYANSIECQEQFPVDYYAFKKRHSKWTQGNLEFLKKYGRFIFTSSLSWYEKFDLILFTFNLPLMAVFSIYLIMNLIIFPLLKFSPHYELWILIPTILVFLAPTLNDIIYFLRVKSIYRFITYWLSSLLLYGSLFFLSLTTYLKSMLGVKARFIVTPKSSKALNLFDAIFLSKGELFYGAVLTLISLIFTHSILPVILIIIPAFSSPLLFLLHKKENMKVMILQEPLMENNAAMPLKASIESISFSRNALLLETDILIVANQGEVKAQFLIADKKLKDNNIFLTVEEQKKFRRRIRYPLNTTMISFTDISDLY